MAAKIFSRAKLRLERVQMRVKDFFSQTLEIQSQLNQKRAMSERNVSNLFTDENQTEQYAKHRPTYPAEVFEAIAKFCQEGNCTFDFAVDAGCGSGQSTLPIAKYFKKVVGVDVSPQQISKAPELPNVTYRVSQCENMGFVDAATVDLLSVSQAFHWMDQDKFFKEADRIIKPGGSLVLLGYGIPDLSHPDADAYFKQVYRDILLAYFEAGREMIDNKYANVSLPYQDWKRDDNFSIVKSWSVKDFIGYLESWSGYAKYKKVNPSENLLEEVEKKIILLLSEDDSDPKECKFDVTWPVFLLMGHKPSSR